MMNSKPFAFMRSPLKREDFYTGIVCLLPSIAVVAVFTLYPIGFSLYLSFHEWAILSPAKPYVGLQNYIELFTSREFWHVLGNTALYTLGVVPIGACVSLGLAVLLNRKLVASGFFKTTFFLPALTSTIAVSIVWLWLYDANNGFLNYLLRLVGLKPVPWLISSKTALLSIVIMMIWKNAGYHMIMFLAGLQGIPDTYYEAAQIDGANGWQKFRYITWPMIKPVLAFVLVTNTIFTFQSFEQIYTMTGGGPSQSTDVVVYYLYQRAFEFQEMGYASAISWVIFVILLILTIVQLRLSRKEA